jgi:NTP pyrophosphatase (non-canonical NTP hydrolase)
VGHDIIKWLDGSSTHGPEITKLIRIMKLTEEAGEVTQAVIGTLGQNPRKGVTHTWEDVQAELCDVIVTAMVALATLTPDARETFNAISPASPAGRSTLLAPPPPPDDLAVKLKRIARRVERRESWDGVQFDRDLADKSVTAARMDA